MDEHPIQGVMTTAMENLKEMIDVNTIIGDPVETPDGGVILTVSKVGFGFAMGGSEFKSSGSSSDGGGSSSSGSDEQGGQNSYLPFGGGSGGGVSITPIAFLVVNKHGVNMLHLEQNTHLIEKMIDLAPTAFEKIQKMTSNFSNKKQQQQGQSNKESLDFEM
ncbi:GerW family sporulation protein [Lederbergia panacisoli]|uniref:GerW family sporulation protein n=1 Tax=Lederbergia panacisoli TaxID=1255251 RepID=UPI00214AE7D2|nr:GerW family sporulation protein [Lederbergia panacisoli]MCR2821874.1 GerW family sporulation protein [Lederbergia panacisoli]